MNLLLHARNQDVDHILPDTLQHLLVIGIKLIVLRAHHNRINALRHTIVAILNGHLTLRVRAQIGHHLSLLANLCQRAHQKVSQVERHGHIALRLVGGIPEHHSLVAGTLVLVLLAVYATVDVNALLMNGGKDTAGIAIKLIFALRIANALDGIARNGLQVDIRLRAHLAHNHHLTCGDKCLDGAARLVVVG